MLKEALLHYNMSHARVELIRHNENITYCGKRKYLLRMHKSKEGFDTKWHYTEYSIFQIKENEMKYLEFLRSKGILVQTPIRNREHKLVTILSDGTVVTMLHWLP